MRARLLIALTAALGLASAVHAQTLGDVAKQEDARRKSVKAPAKVYTNDNLRPTSPASPAGAQAATATTADSAGASSTAAASAGATADGKPAPAPDAKAAPAADGKSAATAETKPSTEVKDEAYWKKRIGDARAELERTQQFADALQVKINSLTNDWSARDDPAQRQQLAAQRDKALADLARGKKGVQDATKAIADIQDEARRAGVPAGWVR